MEERKLAESEVKPLEDENTKDKSTPVGESIKEQKQKKNKKFIYGVVFISVLVVACIGIFAIKEQSKQKILDSIKVTFVEKLEIEYGTKDFDFNQLIKEKSDDVVLPKQIDTMTLGKKELVFKVEKEGVTKDFPIMVEIVDTKAPEIKIKEETVTIDYDTDYDIKNNIESVKDIIDGDVPYSETAKDNNYYIFEGKVDSSNIGDYSIKIIAVDKNGLKSEKEFLVHVNEKEQSTTPVYDPATGTYTKPTNGGGNTNSNGTGTSGGGGSNTPAQPIYRSDIANTYVSQINAYRQQNGFSALPISGEAQAEANMRAMQLVSNYGHNESSGFTENIGKGDIGYNFYVGWVNSSIHNSTMLDDWYSSFAVSVVEYNGQWYAVTSFKITY